MYKMNLQLFAGAADIVLGEGVFSIGATAIALTRGGGQFVVEREFREIPADGDFGPVKGRLTKVKSVAKLTMNALEILPANLPAMYAATSLSTATPGHSILTGSEDIEDADYQTTVKWTGKTKGGKAVVITLQNAINLENIDWSLVDKEELVAQLIYTATYDPSTRTTEPWSIDIATT
jgi:hypothetical protein